MTADRGTLSSVAASFGARACVAPRAHLKRSYRNTKRALLECTEKNEPIAIAGRQAQQVAFCFRQTELLCPAYNPFQLMDQLFRSSMSNFECPTMSMNKTYSISNQRSDSELATVSHPGETIIRLRRRIIGKISLICVDDAARNVIENAQITGRVQGLMRVFARRKGHFPLVRNLHGSANPVRNSTHLPETAVVSIIFVALVVLARSEDTDLPIHIDHVMLGVSNLDSAVSDFEKATGVRPILGGTHPSGTQNALVSLGRGTYLELIAAQPDAKPSGFISDLAKLNKLTPIGWAVSGADAQVIRERLLKNGFSLTDPKAGSRLTPSGATLRWETFELKDEFPGAPFFISWSPQSPHPSSTSPTGCTLDRWTVSGPNPELLARLQKVFGLPFEISKSQKERFILSLSCPKGKVVFGPAAQSQ